MHKILKEVEMWIEIQEVTWIKEILDLEIHDKQAFEVSILPDKDLLEWMVDLAMSLLLLKKIIIRVTDQLIIDI